MGELILTDDAVEMFGVFLRSQEKSRNTVEKYVRDARRFISFLSGRAVGRETAAMYKTELETAGYSARSINSMISSVNRLFDFLGRGDLHIKSVKLQRRVYSPEVKELSVSEYRRLCMAAQRRKNKRLGLIIETICVTGIRVSELRFITVEAVRRGEAIVTLKGKTRCVFIPKDLKRKLLRYAAEQGIKSGMIFVTKSGRAVDRSNIWRGMKSLCLAAGVNPEKVFPHNLRHLFARCFYKLDKDIAKLADVLGHSSIDTTRLYVISSGAEHRKLIDRMKLII